MRHSWRIGRIAGIDINVDSSWFIIYFLLTWMLATSYFPQSLPSYRGVFYWVISLLTSLLVFASVLIHELAHSLVAIKQGDVVRSITLFILGGVAQITEEPKDPISEFVMAIAGPLVSFFLGSFFFMLSLLLLGVNDPLFVMISYLGLINIVLGAFNLLPGFPMDGGRVLRSIVWKITGDLRKATQVASFSGRAFSFLLISIGIFEILQGSLSGLWLVFIGWFLHNAAVKGYQQVLMRIRLNNVTAEDLMVENLKTVPGHVTVQELVDVHILKKKERVFIVVDDEKMEGIVCLEDVKTIPRNKWKSTDVNEIMIPREEMEIVSSDTDGERILAKLMSRNIRQVFVMDGNSVRGVISRDDIQRYMQLRSELDKK